MKRRAQTDIGDVHNPRAITVFLLTLVAGLCLFARPMHAGGPLKVAGISGFNAGTAGTPLTWPQGAVQYYTDQGDLSPVLPQDQANAFVADTFLRWTSVATAALSATRAGQLDEDVNGSNVVFIDYGQVNMPADIQPAALAKPVAIVYDLDGKVTDALLGQGAGSADMCGSNAAYGGPRQLQLRRSPRARPGGAEWQLRPDLSCFARPQVPPDPRAGARAGPGLG
jgi:hypothetical protein